MSLSPARQSLAAGDQVGGYQIIRLSRGHYNRLYMPVSIEGTAGSMIISTTGIHTAVSRDKYHSLVPREGQSVPAKVEISERPFPVALTQDFHLGGVDLGRVPVAMVPGHNLYDRQMIYEEGSDHQYDGVICADILRRYHAIIDCGRGALYIHPGSAQKVSLGAAFSRAGWTRVPMTDFGKRFAVPCVVDGHRFRMLVSTSTPFTLVDSDQLELAKISRPEVSENNTLLAPAYRHAHGLLFGNFQVGDFLAVDTQSLARKSLKAGIDRSIEREEHMVSGTPILGILSGNFLAHNGAIIDVDDQALYLKRMPAATP